MTDFLTGEAGTDELFAPHAGTHWIDFKRSPAPRPAPGHADPAEARHKGRPADDRESLLRATPVPAAGRPAAVKTDLLKPCVVKPAVDPAESSADTTTRVASAGFMAGRFCLTAAPLLLADALALAGCGALSMLGVAALASRAPHVPGAAFPPHTALALLPLLLAYAWAGLYPGVGTHPAVELQRVVRSNTFAWLAVTAALLATGAPPRWLAFFTATWLGSVVAVPLARALARGLCAGRSWWGYPAVVIGPAPAAAAAFAALRLRPQCGLKPRGTLDIADRDAAAGNTPSGSAPAVSIPAVSIPAVSIPAVSAAWGVVALPGADREELAGVLENCRTRFPHLLLLSALPGQPSLWRDARDCGGGLTGTALRNGLLLPGPRLVKRITDVLLTSAALLLGLPLLAAIALAVKLSGPGPVFFGHTRLGRGGRRFKAWKFRTMRPDAGAVLRRLLDEDPAARREWEKDHKLRRDPRVTRVGELLRKTSLDELPQLWNVLTGDMSLVGPRPIIDEEIPKYGDVYRLYGEVLPGITGLWQVSGRNDTTYPERIALDAFYVRNWSPWLDLHILARTVKTICRQEGAY